MAAVLGRTEIGVKKIGSTTATVPDSPVAKLMYYLNCVCYCVEADEDATIRRLRDYRNYSKLSDEEEAKLLLLCLALSPDKLIGVIFIPTDNIEGTSNQFLEVSAMKTQMVVSDSLVIGGHQKKVQKLMMFKKVWMESYYLDPLRSFQQRQRRALPPPRRENNDCIIL